MSHTCHARGCDVEVPPRLLMCKRHWFMVPWAIRERVKLHYRHGQCDDKDPSPAWLEAAREAIDTVAEKEGRGRQLALPVGA